MGLVDLLWLGAALLISVCVLTKSYLVVVFCFRNGSSCIERVAGHSLTRCTNVSCASLHNLVHVGSNSLLSLKVISVDT